MNSVAAPTVTSAAVRVTASPVTLGAPTYYYRTDAGARASTTTPGAIPAGAVLERVT